MEILSEIQQLRRMKSEERLINCKVASSVNFTSSDQIAKRFNNVCESRSCRSYFLRLFSCI